MRNTLILKILVVTVVVLVSLVSCSDKHMEVQIFTPRGEAVDFAKYDKVLYADLEIKSPPKNYDPKKELDVFFLEDIPRIIGRDVEHCKNVEKIDKSIDALLITGKLTFDIKIRRQIKEQKSEKGKKEKKFVKVHHWTLNLEIKMKETNTGKEIFVKKYSEKLMDADVDDPKFNFEKLFFALNNRFGREITTIKKMQRRFLLSR